MSKLSESCLNACCLAQTWLRDAEIRGSSSQEIFRRLLDSAIKKYDLVLVFEKEIEQANKDGDAEKAAALTAEMNKAVERYL